MELQSKKACSSPTTGSSPPLKKSCLLPDGRSQRQEPFICAHWSDNDDFLTRPCDLQAPSPGWQSWLALC